MEFLGMRARGHGQSNFVGDLMGILLNNVSVSMLLLGGGLCFRLIPYLIAALNGWIIGLVVASLVTLGKMSLVDLFLLLVPHGIFEIPAIVAAATLGLCLNDWKQVGPDEKIGADDLQWVARCMGFVMILLAIAAVIEATLMTILSPGRR